MLRSYKAEPSCQTALGKKKCNKSAQRWRKYSTTGLFFYKKLYVKHVKINEVLKTKEEKYVGQSHPASKSLNVIKKKKKFWTSTTISFQNQFCLTFSFTNSAKMS